MDAYGLLISLTSTVRILHPSLAIVSSCLRAEGEGPIGEAWQTFARLPSHVATYWLNHATKTWVTPICGCWNFGEVCISVLNIDERSTSFYVQTPRDQNKSGLDCTHLNPNCTHPSQWSERGTWAMMWWERWRNPHMRNLKVPVDPSGVIQIGGCR